jgi:hypothetical protein
MADDAKIERLACRQAQDRAEELADSRHRRRVPASTLRVGCRRPLWLPGVVEAAVAAAAIAFSCALSATGITHVHDALLSQLLASVCASGQPVLSVLKGCREMGFPYVPVRDRAWEATAMWWSEYPTNKPRKSSKPRPRPSSLSRRVNESRNRSSAAARLQPQRLMPGFCRR